MQTNLEGRAVEKKAINPQLYSNFLWVTFVHIVVPFSASFSHSKSKVTFPEDRITPLFHYLPCCAIIPNIIIRRIFIVLLSCRIFR